MGRLQLRVLGAFRLRPAWELGELGVSTRRVPLCISCDPGAPSRFLFLLVRHLLLEAMHLFLVASLLLVAMPGAPSGFLLPVAVPLLLVAMHLATSSFVLPFSPKNRA